MTASLSLVLSIVATASIEGAPAPPIAEVTIYPDRALVTRRTEIPCTDRLIVPFGTLPPTFVVDSLQADARGAKVLAVRTFPGPPPADAEARASRLASLREELETTRRRLARLAGARDRAGGYGELVASLIERLPWSTGGSPSAITAAADSVLDGEVAAEKERLVATERLATLERELEEVTKAPPSSQAVEVHASCGGRAGPAEVRIRYMVTGASWEPATEARLGDDEGEIELSAHAIIRQQTGESWARVRLRLSTVRPGEPVTPPEIRPTVVRSSEDTRRTRLVAASEAVEVSTSFVGNSAGTTATTPRAALELVAPDPADVPSDGTNVRLRLARSSQRAPIRFRALPRISDGVFRVAELVNTTGVPLLPGPVFLHDRRTFVGKQHLAQEIPRDARFSLSFGSDPGLHAGRLIVREVARKAGLFGGERHHEFAYRFQLASHASSAVEVEVIDQIPVSELEEVKVVVLPPTSPGHTVDGRDGFVTWRIRLGPQEEKMLDLAFRVEVPARYQ